VLSPTSRVGRRSHSSNSVASGRSKGGVEAAFVEEKQPDWLMRLSGLWPHAACGGERFVRTVGGSKPGAERSPRWSGPLRGGRQSPT
jgi:hypothetical protein